MKSVIQVLACLALFAWLMVAMMSPMMMGSPESLNSSRALWNITTIVGYPIVIGVLFYVLGWGLLGLSPRALLFLCSAPPLILLLLFGIPQAAFNQLRGVNPSGYTMTDRAVYKDGWRIDGADPKSFTPLPGSYDDYARDTERVYYRARPIPGADPASFAPLSEQNSGGYWRDRNAVYLEGKRSNAPTPPASSCYLPFTHAIVRACTTKASG